MVTRAFRAKLQNLKDHIFKKEIFEIVIAHVIVEYKKKTGAIIHTPLSDIKSRAQDNIRKLV